MRIGLLGTLQVHDDAGNPVRIGGHRVRSLLILLALDPGRVVPAAALIGRLWPADPPADAPNALQTLVSRLRSALRGAGAIESHPVGYRLVIEPGSVDVTKFEELARQGSAALAAGDAERAGNALREALAIWRGPALADVADAEFARGPSARLEELRLAVVHDRIEADLELGESAGVIGELRSLVAADPLAERSRVLLMRALQAAGRQAGALAVYTQARELLADQLGVDPSPELERAYLAVLRQEDQLPAKRVPAIPPDTAARQPPIRRPLGSFVGREADLRGVRERLGEHRLVTLTGPGGIGKTRLATEVAEGLDGTPVHLVELARVTAGGDVPFAVLDAVVGRERSLAPRPADPLERLEAALVGRDAVVILDNCEHLVDAAAEVADRILAGCPRMRILATSREPLRITGEVLWPVAPLPEDAAIRLLTDRAAAVRPGFRADGGNAGAVGRICRALDGMPLAIELAAVRLRMLSPGQLAERLDDRFTLLTGGSRSAMPRHQTLRAVVDWSWESLSKPERILARRLSIFPGDLTLEAAEDVCADTNGLPAAEVLTALSGLVDKSIVLAGDGNRYRMLETIRAYGAERLTQAGEYDEIRARFVGYYLNLAETADPLLRGAEQPGWLRELEAELDNLHSAIRLATGTPDPQAALRLVRALGWYWVILGNIEAEVLAREVLRLPADVSSPLMAEAWAICAMTAAGQSWDIEPVREDLVAAAGRIEELFADPFQVHPLAAFAKPMLFLSDMDVERAIAELEKYTTAPDPWQRGAMTLMCAIFSAMLGRPARASELLQSATEQLRPLGDAYLSCTALAALADFKATSGDREGALAALREALGACGDLGATVIDQGYFEGRMAALQIRLGDLDAAREHLDRTGDVRAKNADTGMWLDLIRAELAWARGDDGEATRQCESILAELATKDSVWWNSYRATVQARLAMVVLGAGDRSRATGLLATALRGAAGWVEHPPLATVIDAVAVLAVDDDPALAAALLGAAHTIRGSFDECGLDAPAVRETARLILGAEAYEAAYQRGRDLTRDDAVALADSAIDGSPTPRENGPFSRS